MSIEDVSDMNSIFRRSLLFLPAAALLVSAVAMPAAPVAAAPAWPALSIDRTIGGFSQVTNIVSPNDGTDRLFVTEKTGLIKVVKAGVVLPTPALDVSAIISTNSERGLLGLAFPPNFASKQYAYIYLTNTSGNSYFYRVRVSATNSDAFDLSTRQLILSVAQPYANHNGGQLAFGPDGYLYIGLGDGGSARDPQNRSQNRASLLGKILRIDVESTPSSAGYRIPRSNPFYGQRGRRGEIWAYGLRNPWRFSFDARGNLWIGDVGQNAWEEIDRIPTGAKGRNLGWSLYEGHHLMKARSFRAGFTWPISELRHPAAESVTGGYVYTGTASPSMRGTYFFGDFVTGRIFAIRPVRVGSRTVWSRSLRLDTPYNISTFGLDQSGELWFADFTGGTIRRLAAP
ncbi:MAG: PQQ-dependent sugar dehydrogenase [Coriobacteriia bacterium]|nr:PQQ-dependent sugar dehydrogenase [Coriobacteriia bacterium]